MRHVLLKNRYRAPNDGSLHFVVNMNSDSKKCFQISRDTLFLSPSTLFLSYHALVLSSHALILSSHVLLSSHASPSSSASCTFPFLCISHHGLIFLLGTFSS